MEQTSKSARKPRLVPAFSPAELVLLTKTDNWHNFLYIAADWGSIVAVAFVSIATQLNPFVVVVACIWIGSRQRALLNLFHEGSHRKLFSSRRLNDFVTRFALGYPLLLSLPNYRSQHKRHHAFLWDSERDPDAVVYASMRWCEGAPGRRQVWFRILFQPIFVFLPLNLRDSMRPEKKMYGDYAVLLGFWVVVFVVFALINQVVLVLLFWTVPFCTALTYIWYLSFIGEHAGLRSLDPYQSTRGWWSSAPIRWLLSPHRDDLFHIVHHLYPGIPHYRLGPAHELLYERIAEYRTGHHCLGFFWSRDGAQSVIDDLVAA